MNTFLKFLISSAAGLACASGQIRQFDQPLDPEVRTLRVYSTWTLFLHPRFGFELPIPPGVRAVGNPEAANEPLFQSFDQNFKMSAWGGITREIPAKVFASEWNSALRKADRKITYHRRGKTWFVVSGTDVRGIEFYEKFTMSGQQVAFLDITFPRSRLRQYEPWVEQIEDGFRPVALRNGLLELPQQLARSRPEAVREQRPADPKTSAEMTETAPTREQEPKVTELTSKERPEAKVPTITSQLPSADKVAGKPGFVHSPFAKDRIVDVVGMPSGTIVKCPYSMKMFRVP